MQFPDPHLAIDIRHHSLTAHYNNLLEEQSAQFFCSKPHCIQTLYAVRLPISGGKFAAISCMNLLKPFISFVPVEYRLHTKGEVAKSLGNQAPSTNIHALIAQEGHVLQLTPQSPPTPKFLDSEKGVQ